MATLCCTNCDSDCIVWEVSNTSLAIYKNKLVDFLLYSFFSPLYSPCSSSSPSLRFSPERLDCWQQPFWFLEEP
jgi:hypothetical protein